jgi:hypothetical protein
MDTGKIHELSLQPFDYVDTAGSEDSESHFEPDTLIPMELLRLGNFANLRSLDLSLGGGVVTDTIAARLLSGLKQLQVLAFRDDEAQRSGFLDIRISLALS